MYIRNTQCQLKHTRYEDGVRMGADPLLSIKVPFKGAGWPAQGRSTHNHPSSNVPPKTKDQDIVRKICHRPCPPLRTHSSLITRGNLLTGELSIALALFPGFIAPLIPARLDCEARDEVDQGHYAKDAKAKLCLFSELLLDPSFVVSDQDDVEKHAC